MAARYYRPRRRRVASLLERGFAQAGPVAAREHDPVDDDDIELLDDADIQIRLAIVRNAKRMLGRDLDVDELDRLL